MADSSLHFAIGLAAGTAILLPGVLKRIVSGSKTSQSAGHLLAVSYALALFAIIPNILRHGGLPEFFCSGWWMNLFLFNPLLDKLKAGGMLIGEIMIVILFTTHYSLILLAIARNQHRANMGQSQKD